MGTVLKMQNETSGNHFRAWRKWHNDMKLVDLAVALGKDPSWSGNLSRLERGLQRYTEDILAAIAAVHGVEPKDLLGPPPPGTRSSAAAALAPAGADTTADKLHADELHILYCYRKMNSSSRRYVYHLCGDLQLLGDQAPDPFAMRGLVNFLPVAMPEAANDKPQSHPVPTGKKS